MTLQEGKRKVCELLDEYGLGGGVDAELEAKMADLFDMAQKDLAARCPIVRSFTLTRIPGVTEYEMPRDFRTLRYIERDGVNRTSRYRWRGEKLVVPENERGVIEIGYTAIPATISPDTPESTAFEIREDAQQAMPFFVAAMVLANDLVSDANIFLAMYRMAADSLPEESSPAPIRLRCTLFRG